MVDSSTQLSYIDHCNFIYSVHNLKIWKQLTLNNIIKLSMVSEHTYPTTVYNLWDDAKKLELP
jgi:hypothetical protein